MYYWRERILEMVEVYSIAGCAEPVSCISHLVAALVFFVLSIVFYRKLVAEHPVYACGFAVFGAACVGLLLISSMYHLLPLGDPNRELLRLFDHAAIYVMIAATICVVHVVLFRGWKRWLVVPSVWLFALSATVIKVVYFNQLPEYVGLLSYLGFGWFGLFSAIGIYQLYGASFILPLFYGGLSYSFGAILEYLRKPVLLEGVLGPHEIFHFTVIAGMAFHWRFVVSALQQKGALPQKFDSTAIS